MVPVALGIDSPFDSSPDARRAELRRFLRAKRRAVEPAETPAAKRRVKAGLTIVQVAALAGVSTTWYSALERGEQIRVSHKMLDNLAVALHLSTPERTYLHALADPATRASGVSATVPPVLRDVVDGFHTGPAFVMNGCWDVRYWNAIAASVYFLSEQDAPIDRNLLWKMFTERRVRAMHTDWERVAAQMVAVLHMNYGKHPGDAPYRFIVQRLRAADPAFVRMWNRYSVNAFTPTHAELHHPTLGQLAFEYVSFEIPDDRFRAYSVVLQPPLPDTGTEQRIAELFPRNARDVTHQELL